MIAIFIINNATDRGTQEDSARGKKAQEGQIGRPDEQRMFCIGDANGDRNLLLSGEERPGPLRRVKAPASPEATYQGVQ